MAREKVRLKGHELVRSLPHRSITIPLGLDKYGPTPVFELAALAWALDQAQQYVKGDWVIVEIGSLLGASAITMASISTKPIVAIDPHDHIWDSEYTSKHAEHADGNVVIYDAKTGDTLYLMQENLEAFGLTDKVEIVQDWSKGAAENWDGRKIGFFFIDGDHSYLWCKHDYWAFQPYFVDGAYVVFHDYMSYPQVTQAVNEILEVEPLTAFLRVGSLLICKYKTLDTP